MDEELNARLTAYQSPLPPESCIFKVPEALRRHNPKAYEPHVVSIGPFHRRRDHEKLQRRETVKQCFLATALSEAGVKFKKDDSADNLLNIKFDNGVLTSPELAVTELTEPLFRNLIAFEQCYDGHSHQITSYAVFMDKLICSVKDIKLLSEKKS
ncbi:PREDICTED: UPF0481 protein At3g47200-like [Prunus mume]|uniref:UPF0481 protein At3g47200-like n=1 Tax=Prunus mume TaxID=102107 RepID=A0ABM1LIF4_PRUMU|nr:PREDICTED: UPF0481 protein At3g47200-like [Prunus mume]